MERTKKKRMFVQRSAVAVLMAALVLTGCGKQVDAYVDPAFTTYVNDFENKIGISTRGITIKFSKTLHPVIGICFLKNDANEIVIDPDSWGNMTDSGREELLFHELGHCAMYLDHNDERTAIDGLNAEASIMNSYWFGETRHYKKYRENYKEALKFNTLIRI